MPPIIRLTLFKIPNPAVLQHAIQKYTTLSQDALKDGKPYIQTSAAWAAHADPRARGYTLVARTVFLSSEDMAYYDGEDAAHAAIKALLRGEVEDGPPVVVCVDG